jgi:catechol 2,3-dioxygenase-like lactoylglutathione lyase family enzyme
MKGDDRRAALLATVLDGGPVADEVEPLTPAVKRVREVLRRLAPDPDRVAALLPRLYEPVLAAQPRPAVELAHPTLYVRDMEAALAFYRDALGLDVRDSNRWFSTLAAGGACVALHWTGNAQRPPQVGDVLIEFRTDDLDQLVRALRRRHVPVDVKTDRYRGRVAEVRDPDGHAIVVTGGGAARPALERKDTATRVERSDE